MHLIMIVTAVAIAWLLRLHWSHPQGNWQQRFEKALFLFLFPSILLLMTAIAVLCMGPQGQMVGLRAGWFSYIFVLICLAITAILGVKLSCLGWKSLNRARHCPILEFDDKSIRVLDTEVLFAAQIGFWKPELVVSQGLLQTLSSAHIQTVLTHEQGHYYYRDTFWLFWLGWIRECTAWLPNTDTLWQELLILREMRADNWAALKVDPLTLAESLLMVVSNHALASEIFCAAIDSPLTCDRLEQRINALLTQPQPISPPNIQSWLWFLLAFIPLVTVIFHR